MSKISLKGVIDMHVHSNPDIRHRAYDDFELMEAGIRAGARGIVIKTHQGTTMDRAYLCNQHNHLIHRDGNDFTMFGSITLNRVVGGINLKAVEVALKLGARVVWLPTQSAKNHLIKMGQDVSTCVEVVRDGKVLPEVQDLFRLVNEHGAVLGTAHLSPKESFLVVEAARNAGVKHIVVTHPEWWIVDMSLEDQIRIVKDYDVVLERCYAQNMGGGKYKSNLPDNVDLIKEIGYEHILVSTDGGQVENPHWEIALAEYMEYLVDHGIPGEHVDYMTKVQPAKLLGLETPLSCDFLHV